MLHHVCDVAYDEDMCGPIRSCKYGSTNWLINMLDIRYSQEKNLLKAIIKNLVLFDLPTLAFLSTVLKSVVLLKVGCNSQSVYEFLRSLLLTLINSTFSSADIKLMG